MPLMLVIIYKNSIIVENKQQTRFAHLKPNKVCIIIILEDY